MDIWGEILGVVARTGGVVKMRKHLPLYRKFSMLCIEDRVVADHAV